VCDVEGKDDFTHFLLPVCNEECSLKSESDGSHLPLQKYQNLKDYDTEGH
jgi:hypothetical protein